MSSKNGSAMSGHGDTLNHQENPSSKAVILLVEDDFFYQSVLSTMLGNAGYTVLLSSEGKKALEILHEKEVHLVIMDLQLPGIDGVATTQAIRNGEAGGKASQTPVIAYTARVDATSISQLYKIGISDYIVKPARADLLLESIEKVLELTK